MKIIGAGYGRTGTLSLKYALEQLGFDPCYHMQTVIRHPKHVALWGQVYAGKLEKLELIFESFQACTDFPACIYYKELFIKYPDAKVILTVRDSEQWYASAYKTIYQASKPFPFFVRLIILADRSISEDG